MSPILKRGRRSRGFDPSDPEKFAAALTVSMNNVTNHTRKLTTIAAQLDADDFNYIRIRIIKDITILLKTYENPREESNSIST